MGEPWQRPEMPPPLHTHLAQPLRDRADQLRRTPRPPIGTAERGQLHVQGEGAAARRRLGWTGERGTHAGKLHR